MSAPIAVGLSIATVGRRRFQCVLSRRRRTSATSASSNPRSASSRGVYPDSSQLFERMASLQRPGDLLFLGHSENLYRVTERYELIGRTIYRRVGN